MGRTILCNTNLAVIEHNVEFADIAEAFVKCFNKNCPRKKLTLDHHTMKDTFCKALSRKNQRAEEYAMIDI